MKYILILLLVSFNNLTSFAQISNVKTGLWSDQSVWDGNSIPTALDDVTLRFNMIVDINASCRSLNLNGNNIIVNGGVNLQILGNGSITGDSTYISTVYLVLVDGSLIDSVETTTYNYDHLKRLTLIMDTIKNLDYEAVQSIHYSYSLNDTVPYKSELFSASSDGTTQTQFTFDTLITYHYYDIFGKNLKDSVIKSHQGPMLVDHYSTYTIKKYSYGVNKIIGTTLSFPIDVPNDSYVKPDQRDTAILDSHGNIVNNKKYVYNNATQVWELNAVSGFSYDAGQNPFANLSNFKTFGVFPSGETLYMNLPQNNNWLTQNETHSISEDVIGSHYGYSYTNIYAANGKLKEVHATDDPAITGVFGKYIFMYKKL